MRTRIIAVTVAAVLAIGGAVAVVLTIADANRAATAGTRLADVLVVQAPIPAGTTAEGLGDAVAIQQIPARYLAADAVTDLADLAGLVAEVGLEPGEQVLASRFVTPAELAAGGGRVAVPEGLQEVSLALDLQRVAGGAVAPGDRVGVYASLSDGDPVTRLLLDHVLVTAIASTVDADSEGTAAQGLVLVTFAVSADDAQRLVYAAEFGSIWLSEQNDASAPITTGPTTRTAVSG
jgi:pilus assembly protein CpaB